MQVFEVQNNAGSWDLHRVTRPDPEAGEGEVVIRINARSLNFRDTLIRRGHYNPSMPLPLIPLSDGAGTVVEVGRKVSSVSLGERVVGLFSPRFLDGDPTPGKLFPTLGAEIDGTLAEYMVLPEMSVLPVPDPLSDEEAATLPCAAVTAWNALFGVGGASPGDRLLIQGTGDVALFALQFARIAGLETIVLSGSREKLEKVRAMGASTGIFTDGTQDWAREVLERTAGEGVEHVLELGGEKTFSQSLQVLRTHGRISVVGGLSGFTAEVSLGQIIRKAARLNGLLVGSKMAFREMNRAITAHRLRPVVDRIFSFEESLQAYAHKDLGNSFGKIVIRG